MKFGLLYYDNNVKCKNHYINIGDDMQTFAIENLYKSMNIKESEIVRLNYNQIKTYKGEYIILPMNMFGSKGDILPTSEYIIPLFIGFNYTSSKCYELKEYFKNNAPIGCRDEYTLKLMREIGVEAYLSGCMTITLPKRKVFPTNQKVFMVDTPKSLDKYVPVHLKDKIEYITHEVEIEEWLNNDIQIKINDYARYIMNRYKKEATLVVTSRLHCAAPCIAMGIPVIMVKENIDINLSWIDKYIKVYPKREFLNIDWNPSSIDIENIKMKIYHVFEKRLKNIIETKADIYNLSEIYESRNKSHYNNHLIEELERNINKYKYKNLNFIIWGTGAGGTLAYQLIKERYPNFKMVTAVDKYEKGKFYNVEIMHPDKLNNYDFDYIFICTYSGRKEAIMKMEELNIEKDKSYMFLISRVINHSKRAKKNFLEHMQNI